jgi:hypothetical protein
MGWQWMIGDRQAMQFLLAVYPFLIRKKEEARIAIAFQQRKTNRGRSPRPEEREQDAKDRDHLQLLRQTGFD